MDKKRVLLIAGAGTLGSYTSLELLKMGFHVDVIALEELTSLNRNLTYIQARVDDALLKNLFAKNHYDAIVDFIHYQKPELYKSRAKLLLDNTDQLIFLSSYRVYADEEHPVRETSPLLLDVIKDEEVLSNETYAIPKSWNERFLRTSGYKNWTIIRPLISFSHFRLDLVTQGAGILLSRAKAHKKILLPAASKNLIVGVGWAGNVGRLIAHLVCNEKALGETFTMGTGEARTWGEVADYYTELIGAEFVWVDTEDYLQYATGNSFGERCALKFDRLFDRTVDTAKVYDVTGLKKDDFVCIRDGIINELDILSQRPDLMARFDTDFTRSISAKMDAYLAAHHLD